MENRRIIIVLVSAGNRTRSADVLGSEFTALGLGNLRFSDEGGLTVVTGTVSAETDIPALLHNLNGMPDVRNAEADSWRFNQ